MTGQDHTRPAMDGRARYRRVLGCETRSVPGRAVGAQALILSLTLLAACGPRTSYAPADTAANTPVYAPVIAPAYAPVGAGYPAPAAPRFSDADPHPDVTGPAMRLPVHGIDASRWQLSPDWAEAQAAGVSFAFLKATEGGDRIDPAFVAHRNGATAAGIATGAYHFYYWCTPADVQARWFIANVPRRAGALPPILDMEFTPTSRTCPTQPGPAAARAAAAQWLAIVGAHYGQRPILYTTPDFYTATGIGALPATFWLRSTAAPVAARYGGAPWTFWQYSGTGRVPGLQGPVDLNAFYGSASDWAAWRTANAAR